LTLEYRLWPVERQALHRVAARQQELEAGTLQLHGEGHQDLQLKRKKCSVADLNFEVFKRSLTCRRTPPIDEKHSS